MFVLKSLAFLKIKECCPYSPTSSGHVCAFRISSWLFSKNSSLCWMGIKVFCLQNINFFLHFLNVWNFTSVQGILKNLNTHVRYSNSCHTVPEQAVLFCIISWKQLFLNSVPEISQQWMNQFTFKKIKAHISP